jgi:hypothetical protein
MKAFFTSSAVSSSSGSAEQPAIINSLDGSSSEQPARETAQPVKALRSKLQQQLADSAERPLLLSHSAEQLVPMDTSTPTAAELDDILRDKAKREIFYAAGGIERLCTTTKEEAAIIAASMHIASRNIVIDPAKASIALRVASTAGAAALAGIQRVVGKLESLTILVDGANSSVASPVRDESDDAHFDHPGPELQIVWPDADEDNFRDT